MANILVVYSYNQYPVRRSILDHLYSFGNYSEHRFFYLNLAVRDVPRYLHKLRFDLVIYHTIFLSQRWSKEAFDEAIEKARPLKTINAVKVAIPQDEFLNADALSAFINEFDIDLVFSIAPKSEWSKIYQGVDFQSVKFSKVSTGYLDERTVSRIDRLAKTAGRSIDIGYRAWRATYWLGRHGYMKAQISDLFEREAPTAGLSTDISTRDDDVLVGDDWYRFLLKCKYTVGVEGGASILDRDGEIRRRTESYIAEHPGAGFEEVEAACFPDRDGTLRLFALSPRHLEACATRTCQILVEGDYDGVLTPGRHYIELKRDFSNLQRVLETVRLDKHRATITENAYRDIVQSGRFSYRHFVAHVIQESLGDFRPQTSEHSDRGLGHVTYWRARMADNLSWYGLAFKTLFVEGIVRRALRGPAGILPHPIRRMIRNLPILR